MEVVEGKITAWPDHREYGFAQARGFKREVFVHAGACRPVRPSVGARVRLTVETTPRGLRATSCEVISGNS